MDPFVPRLRFLFDAGSGACLWAGDPPTEEALGNPIVLSRLPLTENLRRYLLLLVSWYDTSLDWDDPGGRTLWDDEERARFNRAVLKGVGRVQHELGSAFDVVVEYPLTEKMQAVNRARRTRELEEARRVQLASGKEPFELSALEAHYDTSDSRGNKEPDPDARAAVWEYKYYVLHPDVRTLAEFAEVRKEMDLWRD